MDASIALKNQYFVVTCLIRIWNVDQSYMTFILNLKFSRIAGQIASRMKYLRNVGKFAKCGTQSRKMRERWQPYPTHSHGSWVVAYDPANTLGSRVVTHDLPDSLGSRVVACDTANSHGSGVVTHDPTHRHGSRVVAYDPDNSLGTRVEIHPWPIRESWVWGGGGVACDTAKRHGSGVVTHDPTHRHGSWVLAYNPANSLGSRVVTYDPSESWVRGGCLWPH